MHILLTDILTCPRCGPEFGLILLSQDMRERRVLEGWMGCANCRDRWVVSNGFGEFRTPLGETGSAPAAPPGPAEPEEAMRIAALLGVSEGPAYVLVAGPAARHAPAMADLVENLEVVAVLPGLSHAAERKGVSRIAADKRLPFYGRRLHGVWLGGDTADALLEEGVRVLGPAGRLVLEPAPADANERLARAGLKVLAKRDDTVVAAQNV